MRFDRRFVLAGMLANEALENGELEANAFQHMPYLDNQIKTRGYHIVLAGFTAVWPIGLYSKKHHSVASAFLKMISDLGHRLARSDEAVLG